jgi:hypothetical protein
MMNHARDAKDVELQWTYHGVPVESAQVDANDYLERLAKLPVKNGSRPRDFRTSSVLALIISGRPGDWMLYVPYWLMGLAILPPWIGALVWRGRRLKRALGREGGAE